MNISRIISVSVAVLSLTASADYVAKVTSGGEETYCEDLRTAIEMCTNSSCRLDMLCDLDLAGVAWTPVNFVGQFDGHGHVISNVTVTSSENMAGFFKKFGQGSTTPYMLSNLTFVNVTVNAPGREYVGAVAGDAAGSMSNVTVRGSIKVEGSKYVGGLVGHIYGNIYDCTVDGGDAAVSSIAKDAADGYEVGGIVGLLPEGHNTVIGTTVKNISIYAAKYAVGGIVGRSNVAGRVIGCSVEDTVVFGNQGEEYCGKIVGQTINGNEQLHMYLNNSATEVSATVNQIYGASLTNLSLHTVVGTDVVGNMYDDWMNWCFTAGTFVLYGVSENQFADMLPADYVATTTEQCDGSLILDLAPNNVARAKVYIDCKDSQANFSGVDRLQVVKAGDVISFRVAPKTGYKLDNVYIKGAVATAVDGLYSYTVLAGDVDESVPGGAPGVAIRIVTSENAGPLVYPEWLENAQDAYKTKFDTWAANYGITDRLNADKDAYLLNCSVSEVATKMIGFRIISIEVFDDNVVEIGLPDPTPYNGLPVVYGCATLTGDYVLDEHDKTARFYKAYLIIPVKE